MSFHFGIVIPSVGTPDVLIPTIQRMIGHLPEAPTLIVVNLNPVDQNLPTIGQVENHLNDIALLLSGTQHQLVWSNEGRPIGFGGSCNRGVQDLIKTNNGQPPELTVLFNDDLRTTPGWLEGLWKASQTQHVRLVSEPPSEVSDDKPVKMYQGKPLGVRPSRPISLYGKIGIVGPCSVNVAGIQNVTQDPKNPITERNANHYSTLYRRDNAGDYLSASFLSGFCMAITKQCLADLLILDECGEVIGPFKAETYPIAGYEDNDLCVRATERGWKLIVDGETFLYHLGHQSFDAFFPDMQRGMRNRLAYYVDHRQNTQRENQKIIAVYRVKLETGNDLGLFRASLVGMSRLVHGFAVLLTDNPLEMGKSADFQEVIPTLSPIDREMLGRCMNADRSAADPQKVATAVMQWILATLRAFQDSHGAKPVHTVVECWTGAFNERDERNRVIEIGEKMGADWLWSVDHDELPEERISADLVRRWITHPDPMVSHWDFSWLNHWDSERQIRGDAPWGDAVNGRPTYRGGMHGYRLWRVNKAAPGRIMAGTENGLHCGNSPEAGGQAKRISGFRFRHLGYMRHFDRVRKLKRYSEQDPNPNAWLVGADGYGHLIQEEGATFYPYVQHNGIGLHMLVYERESADDVASVLDYLYGVVDRVVLIWTGEWKESDQGWLQDGDAPFSLEEWPSTGPGRELAQVASLFKASLIHHPLADNIAEARNAGISYLRQFRHQGLGWALFLDPDEVLQTPMEDVIAIRRMAEVSNGWGWLFRFHNLQPGGKPPTASESLRMTRLDPEGLMMMNGRVHEGFEIATQTLVERGEHPQFRYSPFVVLNVGQKLDDSAMQLKLEKYVRLLRLELEDHPDSVKAWVSLGLHAENEGDEAAAMECYRRAMVCPGNSYLPFKEAAFYHLRMARILVGEVVERTAGAHAYHRIAKEQLEWLRENAPDRPLLGEARANPGARTGLGFDLPPSPILEK